MGHPTTNKTSTIVNCFEDIWAQKCESFASKAGFFLSHTHTNTQTHTLSPYLDMQKIKLVDL